LKFELIDHLLLAGALVNERDGAGRSAVHYAVSPFEDAMFSDVNRCVRRLIESGASMEKPIKEYETLLKLLVSPDHAALDPWVTHKYGANVQADCIRSVMENVESEYKKRKTSGLALRYALLHGECPLDIIEVLCGYGAARDMTEGHDSFLSSADVMHMAPLQIATRQKASNVIISTLLKHGADASSASPHVSAAEMLISFEEIEREVSRLFEGSQGTKEASLTVRSWLDSIPSLTTLFFK
jgi:hypothetical protein